MNTDTNSTDDRTISILLGLPVLVTFNTTTGKWSVDVDLTEVSSALREVDPQYSGVDADDLAEFEAGWDGWNDYYVSATADISFSL